ncbi:tetratricopeptide repeat protein [Lujinxingia vulgaris]|nr:tetratricopeptide repeat protein [Lujinxingia vulgaris]
MKQRNRQIFWRGALLALGATLVWSPPMVSQAQTSVTALSNAERQDLASVRDAASAFEAGRLAEARALAGARDDSASLIVRARFAHWSGDDAGALQMSEQAIALATGDATRADAAVAHAEMLFFTGDWDEAEALLRDTLAALPQSMRVRLALGELLWERGERDEATAILEAMAARYNDGLIDDPRELVAVGRGMQILGRMRDANRALGRAARQSPDHPDVHIAFAELMLASYNHAEAEDSLQRALEAAPQHPDAHRLMAEIEFFVSGNFAAAEDRLARADEIAPHHPGIALQRARFAMTRGEWARAADIADRVLQRSPHHGDALSLLAAVRYLGGDRLGFENASKRFIRYRTRSSKLWRVVGEAAALNNRHAEAVRFFEEALDRNPDDAGALAGLGLALTRTGDEARALGVLERAAQEDRFHVRVHNMLELYQRGLRDYLTAPASPGLRLRAHMRQHELLKAASLPLVDEAHEVFSARYDLRIEPLIVEIYPEPQTFSVRSVGVPQIDPHGICFGDTVLLRSPADADFNWEMVLWHETAHAYHLRLSEARVPRWFTEGLAEYESGERDPSYRRFHDEEIARRLQHGSLPALSELGEAFLAGRGFDVIVAYQLASLAIDYIVEIGGRDAPTRLLRGFADSPRFDQLAPALLGRSIEELDAGFEAWLKKRYAPLMAHPMIDIDRVRRMAAGEEVEHADAVEEGAYKAFVAALEGRGDQARVLIASARRRAAGADTMAQARVEAVLVHAFNALGQSDEALQAGRRALDAGLESPELRLALARAAAQREQLQEALVHAEAAASIHPQSAEAWTLLEERAAALGQDALARRARQARFELSPHDPRLAQDMVESSHGELQLRAARRWAAIETFRASAHLAVASALLELERPDEAIAAFERAALSDPQRASTIKEVAREQLTRGGWHDKARQIQ